MSRYPINVGATLAVARGRARAHLHRTRLARLRYADKACGAPQVQVSLAPTPGY